MSNRIDKLEIYTSDNQERVAEVKADFRQKKIIHSNRRKGISVVILNLNKPELIVPLVKQLQEQQVVFNKNNLVLEVIIGDTGSNDAITLACLNKLQKMKNCKVVFDLKYQFSHCNNQLAFSHASCEIILFLNNDIIFSNDKSLFEMYQATKKHLDVGVFGALLFFADGLVQHAGVDFFRQPELKGLCYHPLGRSDKPLDSFPEHIKSPAATGAFLAIRTALFEEIGGFDEGYTAECQDIVLCLAALRHGFTTLVLNLGNTIHLENATRPKNEEHWPDRQRFLRKWGSFIEASFL
jgi:GT2 family glycosyltransferase